MLYREIFRIIGNFLFLYSFGLLLPLGVAAYYELNSTPESHPQPHTTLDFLLTVCISFGLAAALSWIGRKSTGSLYRREGIASVVLIWFIAPAISAIPFLSSGTLTNPVQAYFEMTAGLTTTGMSIMHPKAYNAEGQEIPIVKTIPGAHNTTYTFYGTVAPLRDPHTGAVIKQGVEAVGKALLFWRSFTQWLGGVGIVVLFVAVLPVLGIGGRLLFNAETSGTVKEGTTPRIKETAIQLWKIYSGLTVLTIAILMFTNTELEFFDAITLSFSTISTGGFSTKNSNITGYHSLATENVVMLFMFLGSVNFSLYYALIRGKFQRLFEPEFLLYIALIVSFGLLTAYTITGSPQVSLSGEQTGVFSWASALRYGFFQYLSAITSAGFFTTDYDAWPYTAQALLLLAMFLGGMSGSTSGGIKISRIYTLFRVAQYKVESLFRPDHLRILKINNREVDNKTAINVLCFFLIIITMATLGTLIYIFDQIDPETSIGLTGCMLNNGGLSFRMAGPEYSCAFLSNFSLIVSSVLMIFGRLEFYAVLALLVPAFWRQDS